MHNAENAELSSKRSNTTYVQDNITVTTAVFFNIIVVLMIRLLQCLLKTKNSEQFLWWNNIFSVMFSLSEAIFLN